MVSQESDEPAERSDHREEERTLQAETAACANAPWRRPGDMNRGHPQNHHESYTEDLGLFPNKAVGSFEKVWKWGWGQEHD